MVIDKAVNRNTRRTLSDIPFRALGGQPAFRGPDLEEFVRAARIGVLAYVRADGRPGQSPIWYEYADGAFYMSTEAGSPKARALARDPRVCLTIQDESPPYRAAIFDGDVVLSPLPSPAPTDGLAMRYFGRLAGAAYDRMTATRYAKTGLTLIELRPTAVRGFDNTLAISRTATAWLRVRAALPLPRRWL